jgi:predicted Zn-dependent protease
MNMLSTISRIPTIVALVFALVLPAPADNRTRLKPGWNLFSPEQDVEMGQQAAKEAEKQMSVLNNRQATAYVDALGKQLAAHAPGHKYPFQYKIVNDNNINAFALPGGFIYINRGAIEAADNEAQLAGVIAHETGHVVLRHGTNQVSKAYLAQAPLSVLGGVIGSNSIGSVLAQLGVGFATNSLLLRYSRDAERQADLIGTQILYDAGYSPQAMVDFFEKIQAESKGRASEFFSDHPNPESRISYVQKEIGKLGGTSARIRGDSPDFQEVRRMLLGMPAPPKNGGRPAASNRPNATNGRPDTPSTRMLTLDAQDLQLRSTTSSEWRPVSTSAAIIALSTTSSTP